MNITRLLTPLLCLAVLSGCAVQPKSGNVEAMELTPPQASSMAEDAVKLLTSFYAPGKTTFRHQVEPKPFSRALDDALRDRGYAVSTTGGVPLRYVVDSYSNRQHLLRLFAPKVRISRVYGISPDGLRPLNAPTLDTSKPTD